jgi:hypothetical protein
MRAIVKREGGESDMSHDDECTDWDPVEPFAHNADTVTGSSIQHASEATGARTGPL